MDLHIGRHGPTYMAILTYFLGDMDLLIELFIEQDFQISTMDLLPGWNETKGVFHLVPRDSGNSGWVVNGT